MIRKITLFSTIVALLFFMSSCSKNELNRSLPQTQPLSRINTSFQSPGVGATIKRKIYEVISDGPNRGKIYVYDVDSAHRLAVVLPGPGPANVQYNVRGVCANAKTGYLYFTYFKTVGANIYCLDMNSGKMVFDKPVVGAKRIDRLCMNPDGKTLYVPTGEADHSSTFIWKIDAMNGNILTKIYFAHRTHDALWPLSGPLFQECKSTVNNEGRYMYKIDPITNSVSRIGLYSNILGPFTIDSKSHYMVNCVKHLLGMQIADITTNTIYTAKFRNQSYSNPSGLVHAIGYTPDEKEVWEGTGQNSKDVVIWDMTIPTAPVEKQTVRISQSVGTHWITFTIKGDFTYFSPYPNSGQKTEVWNTKTHSFIKTIAGSLTLLEVDFSDSTHKVVAVGDQYGIGRK